jgi:hypothetical protein
MARRHRSLAAGRRREPQAAIERLSRTRSSLALVKTLDPKPWRERHESLPIEAGRMDGNSRVYLLLRASDWDCREELKGHLSGARVSAFAAVARAPAGIDTLSNIRIYDPSSGIDTGASCKKVCVDKRPAVNGTQFSIEPL